MIRNLQQRFKKKRIDVQMQEDCSSKTCVFLGWEMGQSKHGRDMQYSGKSYFLFILATLDIYSAPRSWQTSNFSSHAGNSWMTFKQNVLQPQSQVCRLALYPFCSNHVPTTKWNITEEATSRIVCFPSVNIEYQCQNSTWAKKKQ